MALKEYTLEEIKELKALKVLGRTTESLSPLTLFWTGSGIECNVKASELWIEVESDYEAYEPWMSIVINGTYVSRRMLSKGREWICLFRGMNPEVTKNIKVLKEVQAMPDDIAHRMQIHAMRIDGSFEKTPDRPYKIEFIGDSITSGEGSVGATIEEDWISMWFSTQNNYARMTADAVDADFHIISQSGWGLFRAWDNNPYHVLPPFYEKVCGILKGEKNEALGALKDYDFKSWQPDIVVINLGTNDACAFTTPEWVDEKTGKGYKMRLNEDGSYNQQDLEAFKGAMVSFLTKLRKCNPNATLIWVLGMLGAGLWDTVDEGVKLYKVQSGDEKVESLLLPDTTEETFGARQHPGVLVHEAAAQVLAKRIKEILD